MSADETTKRLAVEEPPRGMSMLAKAGIALLVLAVLLVGAWAYGRSSMAPARAEADATRLRMLLLESRTQVLDAQISLYTTNFGSAAQHLEYAKAPLNAASAELTRLDHDDLATKAGTALQRIEAARDLAAKLSLDANSRAADASRLLGEVLGALPR
jgi:hypothetical protein